MAANDDIERQIADISIQLNKLTRSMHILVGENRTLKRKAGRRLKDDMKNSAPVGKTGNLKKSIQYLPFKSKDAFIGPNYKYGPHAHLVEYGYHHYSDGILRDGWKGVGFIRKSWDRNKNEVLQNLIWLAADELKKIGRELEVRE